MKPIHPSFPNWQRYLLPGNTDAYVDIRVIITICNTNDLRSVKSRERQNFSVQRLSDGVLHGSG